MGKLKKKLYLLIKDHETVAGALKYGGVFSSKNEAQEYLTGWEDAYLVECEIIRPEIKLEPKPQSKDNGGKK